MPLAFYYLFGAVGFAAFALLDPRYLGLAKTVGSLYLILMVVWGVIDTIQYWPRRKRGLNRS
ncbi:hypothetical protein [Tanticharoenia sakaeratensis]|jgi:hypothetical protein|uniref:Uncharacterized protein n=1 Tax=Tanticharoenia sakaeratensis NBRC 103193 TaxID=1231623 RepID=A0A0D6MHV9_9PROT|nr:hypothetical protein [Tanticharoenia sakaeratensis]GAN53045.1 hypothetical protein Tasa_004_110 [Tanticharoenia sakaeratensis NBRC 103193]GBQ19684.1 hypothetical protein AA103193_1113 [Tanticharoenia sakaeratensis NBRC 103193]